MQGHNEVHWHHVPTADNPADLGRRGGTVYDKELWWSGPDWLPYPEKWPLEKKTKASPSIETQKKVQRELLAVRVEVNDC